MSQIRPVQVNNSLRPVLEIKILDSFDWAPNLELAPNSSKRPASNKHPPHPTPCHKNSNKR